MTPAATHAPAGVSHSGRRMRIAVRWSMVRALYLARYLSLTVSAATPLSATQASASVDAPQIVAEAARPL